MVKKILVAVANEEDAPAIVQCAVAFAQQLCASIILLDIVDKDKEQVNADLGILPNISERMMSIKANNLLGDIIKEIPSNIKVDEQVIEGVPYHEIIHIAKDKQADLIIVGSHPHFSILHLLTGGMVEHLSRQSTVPIMVVPCHH